MPPVVPPTFPAVATYGALASDDDLCTGILHCRTPMDILYSCAVVVFISVWVSLHPNVPDVAYVGHSEVGAWLNQVINMTTAVLAPELIVLWAMRQEYMAEEIASELREHGWTTAHGFLALMNGIAVYHGSKFICYARYPFSASGPSEERALAEDIRKILERGDDDDDIEAPGPSSNPTRGDCRDRTHATPPARTSPRTSEDISTQTAVTFSNETSVGSPTTSDSTRTSSSGGTATSPHRSLLSPRLGYDREESGQVLRLLLNAGRLNHLTEHEIMSTLNHGERFGQIVSFMQTMWFIGTIVRRQQMGLFITELEIIALAYTGLGVVSYLWWWNKPQNVRYPYRVDLLDPSSEPVRLPHSSSFWQEIVFEWKKAKERLRRDYLDIRQKHQIHTYLFLPLYPFYFFARQIASLANADGAGRLPPDYMFFCGVSALETPPKVYYRVYIFSFLMGLFHFIRWSSQEENDAENSLWRACTIAVVSLPLLLAATHREILRDWEGRRRGMLSSFNMELINIAHGVLIGLYIMGRYILVVVALTSLRHLPRSALEDVGWNPLGHFG